jgi:hypothetical protein
MKFFLSIAAVLLLFACRNTVDCIDYDKIDSLKVCPPTLYNPVCGCDDVTYPNECVAEKNGVVSWISGPCP